MISSSTKLVTDVGFKGKIIFGWVTGTYHREYLEATYSVYTDVNYNASKVNILGITENYSMEMFFDVFNCYGNILCDSKKYKEYNGQLGDNNPDNLSIIAETSRVSGRSKDFVSRVLKQLYWSTEQGRISSAKWINPRTFMETEGYRELRDDAKGSEWFKTIVNIGIGIGVLVAGFYAYKFYATYKTTKKLTNSPRKLLKSSN